jgi:glycosyltransferase involved in cell wall biosynthesis
MGRASYSFVGPETSISTAFVLRRDQVGASETRGLVTVSGDASLRLIQQQETLPGGVASVDEPLATQVEIVIVETNPSGHRLQYVRHIALAVGDHRWAWLSSKAAIDSDECKVHLGDLSPQSISTTSGSRRRILKHAIGVARSVGARRVIVPDGDKYLTALISLSHSWGRSLPDLSVLLMRTAAPSCINRGRWQLLAKCLAAQVANRMRNVSLHFLTDGFGVIRSRRGYRGISPAPDPVDVHGWTREGGSQLLALPADHLSIGILGGIGPRKNPAALVEAAASLHEVVVVIAGKISPEIRTLAAGNRSWLGLREAGRLIELDRLLTAEEFDGLLKQLTVVAVLHDNDAPSGIVSEAAARGTPAIVASGGWLEQIVVTLGIGLATDVTTEGVRAALASFNVRRSEFESNAAHAACRTGTREFVNALLH